MVVVSFTIRSVSYFQEQQSLPHTEGIGKVKIIKIKLADPLIWADLSCRTTGSQVA